MEMRGLKKLQSLELGLSEVTDTGLNGLAEAQSVASLKLARTELSRQLEGATHQARKVQLSNTISEIDRQIAGLSMAI